MMQRPTDVLVVVVTHNSESVVADCLSALPRAFDRSTRFRLVVVDNASTDRTCAAVRSAAPCGVLTRLDRNVGYAAAINVGVRQGITPVTDAVLVLNPDVRLAAGSIRALVTALEHPGTGIAVPRLVDHDGELLPSLRREPTVLRALGEAVIGGRRAGRLPALGEMVVDPGAYDHSTTSAWATGAVMLIGRSCLQAVGAWDESYFLYSEETDFCLRARDAGFHLRYTPHARAVHLGGESNVSPRLWTILTRNRVRLFRRRHGRVRSGAFVAAVVLNEALRAIAGRATSRAALSGLIANQNHGRAMAVRGHVDGFVCFSAQDWWYFSRGHSDFQLMTRVARTHPVLLVNSLGMRMPTPGRTVTPWRRIARKLRSASHGLATPLDDVPGFHVLTPLFLPVYGDGWLARANQRFVAAQVRRAVARLGMSHPAVVVTLPTAWPVARRLRRARTIAYRSDRYSALPEADGALVARLERELLAAADATVFVSAELLATEGSLARRSVLLRHGVDVERFRAAADLGQHSRLAGIPHPRVGYVGMIDAYTVDIGLLERLANDHPDVEFVLAGPTDIDISRLLSHSNVHHVGVLPHDEVPSFLASIDVALMPWQHNEWIRHCNPVKLKEYLAVGLPVVSTDFPEARRFGELITIARDADHFSASIRDALDGSVSTVRERRRAAASQETWDAQAARLVEVAKHLADPLVAVDRHGRPGRRTTCVAS
jgi:GT2 family glycosyltransferase